MNSKYYEQIDSLRAFAALAVMVMHMGEAVKWQPSSIYSHLQFFQAAFTGVDLFFVISGFVITLSALKADALQTPESRIHFIKRRFFRIFPLFFLTCLFWVVAVDSQVIRGDFSDGFFKISTYFLFIHNLFPSTFGLINAPSWSIALEMQFYILIFFAFYKLGINNPLRILITFVLIAWAYRFLTVLVLPYGQVDPTLHSLYGTQLPGCLDEFSFGIALAFLFFRDSNNRFIKPGWFNFTVYLSLFCVGYYAVIGFFWRNMTYWNDPFMVIFWRTPLSIAFAFVLLAFITMPAVLKPFFRPFNYLGKISYGIYLWHVPVLHLLAFKFSIGGKRLMLLVPSVTILLAVVSWHFLEKPLLKFAQNSNWFSAKKPLADAA